MAIKVGDRPLQAMAKRNLGEAKRTLGDLDSASLDLSESLTLELAMANPTGVTHTRGARAAVLFHLGRFEEAAQEFRELAREFHEQRHPGGEARSLQNLAGALTALCENSSPDRHADLWPEIFSAFDRALALHRERNDPESECVVLNNRGVAQMLAGRLSEASQTFDAAVLLARQHRLPWEEARAATGLGHIAAQQSDPDKALQKFSNAVALAGAIPVPDLMQDIQAGLGRAWAAKKEFARAHAAFESAIRRVEAARARAVSPETRAGLFSQRTRPYFDLASCLMRQGRAGEAWKAVERAKGRTLMDMWSGVPGAFERVATAEEQQGLADREARVTALILEAQTNSARLREESFQAVLQRTRTEAETFRQQILARHPNLALRMGECRVAEPADLAAFLAQGPAVLLEYFVGTESSLLVVLAPPDPGRDVPRISAHHIPVTRTRLLTLVRNYRDRLAREGFEPAADSDAGREIRELSRLLLEPAGDLLDGSKVVGIIPDGVLWELPFAALRRPDGRYFVEHHASFYAPSVSALLAMPRLASHPSPIPGTPGTPGTNAAEMLVLADPALDEIAQIGVPQLGPFVPIPGTRLQANALKSMLGERAIVRLGLEASEEYLRKQVQRVRVLHVATHGLFDASPLHCGLWLARTPGYDGLWSAREIMDGTLPIELAVLAACDTGRGRALPGEGVIGLGWALAAAGCRASILTQWAVADESTSTLMIEFYRRWLARSPAEPGAFALPRALREAQLELLNSSGESRPTRHPFHWAPFMVMGDPG